MTYTYNDKEMYLDLKKLIGMAKAKSIQMKRTDLFDDFSQFCVLQSLRRLKAEDLKNAHLNNIHWLWKDFLFYQFGYSKGKSCDALSNSRSINIKTNDGVVREMQIESQEPNPEQYLIQKEEIRLKVELLQEGITPSHWIDKKQNRQIDSMVLTYLKGKLEKNTIFRYKPKPLAQELDIPKPLLLKSIRRLKKNRILVIKNKMVTKINN